MQEFLSLVKDTVSHVEMEGISPFYRTLPPPLKKGERSPSQKPPVPLSTKSTPKKEEPALEEATCDISVKEQRKALVQRSSLERIKEEVRAVFPKLSLIPPPTSVVVLLFQEKERAFLESVAGAITQHFIPASVHTIRNETECLNFFQNHYLKLVLFSLSDISKFNAFAIVAKHATLHTVYAMEGVATLPLAESEHYREETHLKRSLWNTLKHLPQLSPNLPLIKL